MANKQTEKQNVILYNNSPLSLGLKGNLKSKYDKLLIFIKPWNFNGKSFLNKKKAQHIVEFVLFMPFLIAFIGVVLEITYSFNTNYKFNNAVYEAIGYITAQNKINTSKEDTLSLIEKTARYNMYKNMTPYSDTLKVYLTQTGELDFIVATYTYTSTFTLVNTFFHVVPDMYNYKTVIPLNSAVLRGNNYPILNTELKDAFELYYQSFAPSPETSNPEEATH